MDSDYDTTPFDERATAAAAKAAFQSTLKTLSAAGGIPASAVTRVSLDAPEVFASTPLLLISDTYEAALVALLWLHYWHPRVLAPLALVPSSAPALSPSAVSAIAATVAAAQTAAVESDRAVAQARADAAADSFASPAAPAAVVVFSKHQNRAIATTELASSLLTACVHSSLPSLTAAAAAAEAAAEAGMAPVGAAAAWRTPSRALLRLRAGTAAEAGAKTEAEALASAALGAAAAGTGAAGETPPASSGLLLPVELALPAAAEAWGNAAAAVAAAAAGAEKKEGGASVLAQLQEAQDEAVKGVGKVWSIVEELPDLLASF